MQDINCILIDFIKKYSKMHLTSRHAIWHVSLKALPHLSPAKRDTRSLNFGAFHKKVTTVKELGAVWNSFG